MFEDSGAMPELMKDGCYIEPVCYVESVQKNDHPPLFGERQEPSTPIIFRTKNPEKSRLGLIRKNFGKNLRENVSGEEKAPNLVERGQGVLKYERIIWAKIVELFVITR